MPKIMVADDSPFMRMRLTKLLKLNGFHVIEATDGNEAINRYQTDQPDAVLMDIAMPFTDGLTALTRIIAQHPHAKIIMLSALQQEKVILQALRDGASDFIAKPYEPEKLLSTLKRVLS